MRRLASVLLAGAVAAVAVAAALDAVFSEEPAPRPSSAQQRLRATGVAGELVWSDDLCRGYSVALPSLARRDFPSVGCRVFTRDSLGVTGGEIVWLARPDSGGTTVVLSREAVALEVGDDFRPMDAVWLGGLRYAAVFDGPRMVVALFDGDSAFLLTHVPGWTDVRLRASPSGSYFAIQSAGGALDVRDREGGRLPLPRTGQAIAWSPDERFAAVAAGGAVSILPAEGGGELARLPIAAGDVDWR